MTTRQQRPAMPAGLRYVIAGSAWEAPVRAFESHLASARQLAPLTVRNYLNDLVPYFEFLDKRDIESLDRAERHLLRGYLAWLL